MKKAKSEESDKDSLEAETLVLGHTGLTQSEDESEDAKDCLLSLSWPSENKQSCLLMFMLVTGGVNSC